MAPVAPVAAVEPVEPVAEVAPVAPAGNTVVVEISWVVGGGATTGLTGVVTVVAAGPIATGVVATASGVVVTASGVVAVLTAGVTDAGGRTGAMAATRWWWRIRWALW